MRTWILCAAVVCSAAACEEQSVAPSADPAVKGTVVVLTDATFDAEVLKADTPVLVDFWASWCAPCRTIAPTVEAIAGDYQGRVKVGKVDVDSNSQTAQQFKINAIPALLVFHKGEVKHTFVGVTSKQDIARALDRTLN